jgi:hypothetical protein
MNRLVVSNLSGVRILPGQNNRIFDIIMKADKAERWRMKNGNGN